MDPGRGDRLAYMVVMFSSHQLVSTTKNFFDDKKIFHKNFEQKFDFRASVFYMNVFIYKGTFANKDFENKKLTLLGVVWW